MKCASLANAVLIQVQLLARFLPWNGVLLATLLDHFPELGRGCVSCGESVLVLVDGAENDPRLAILGQDDISVGRLSKILVRVRSKFFNAHGSHRTTSL